MDEGVDTTCRFCGEDLTCETLQLANTVNHYVRHHKKEVKAEFPWPPAKQNHKEGL